MDKKDISLIVAFKAKLDAEYADSLLNKNPFVPTQKEGLENCFTVA